MTNESRPVKLHAVGDIEYRLDLTNLDDNVAVFNATLEDEPRTHAEIPRAVWEAQGRPTEVILRVPMWEDARSWARS